MIDPKKTSKPVCLLSSGLLLIMAIFHGSGINYVNDMVQTSNISELVKTIFPVLFILPTIELIGFAIFGLIAAYMKQQANKILIPLSVLTLTNAILAFYLNAIIPGVVLMLPSLLFMLVAYWNNSRAEVVINADNM